MGEPERGLVVALVEGKGWNILSGRTSSIDFALVKIFHHFTFGQELLNILIKPRFVPQAHVVHLVRFNLGNYMLNKHVIDDIIRLPHLPQQKCLSL